MFSRCGKHLAALKAAQYKRCRPHGFPTSFFFLARAADPSTRDAGSRRELRSCCGRGGRGCCVWRHADRIIHADGFSRIRDEAKTWQSACLLSVGGASLFVEDKEREGRLRRSAGPRPSSARPCTRGRSVRSRLRCKPRTKRAEAVLQRPLRLQTGTGGNREAPSEMTEMLGKALGRGKHRQRCCKHLRGWEGVGAHLSLLPRHPLLFPNGQEQL